MRQGQLHQWSMFPLQELQLLSWRLLMQRSHSLSASQKVALISQPLTVLTKQLGNVTAMNAFQQRVNVALLSAAVICSMPSKA